MRGCCFECLIHLFTCHPMYSGSWMPLIPEVMLTWIHAWTCTCGIGCFFWRWIRSQHAGCIEMDQTMHFRMRSNSGAELCVIEENDTDAQSIHKHICYH